MALSKDELAVENMELKAQLHEIKTALGIKSDVGSESTPLKKITEFNRMRENVGSALGIRGDYYVANETNSMLEAIAELKLQVKELGLTRDAALICARNKNDSLEVIAEKLGIKFTGNTDDIYEAIATLKSQNKLNDQMLKAVAKQLGFDFFSDDEVAIAIESLQEKSTIADQLQSDLINTDFGELRSERNYYRGILDKLCDRLNVDSVEALEYVVKHQEMDLDFTSQHNDDLREQLAESQAIAYKYIGRICELEKELRSLHEPVTDSDLLTATDYTQIIKILLKRLNN